MRLFACLALLVLAVPATVSACEGDCIVAITNAWRGNYSTPIHMVMAKMASEISSLMPEHPSTETSMHYLAPMVDAYNKNSYAGLETAIFPSYFHGKCQQDGVDPPGCPNPDCPVVCGTPGSLVHFFPTLRYIAFNETRAILEALAAPDSSTYKQIEQAVVDGSQAHSRRMSRVFPRVPAKTPKKKASFQTVPPVKAMRSAHPAKAMPSVNPETSSRVGSGTPSNASDPGTEILFPLVGKRSEDVQAGLKEIMSKISAMLENACGGDATEGVSALSGCSWEEEMKAYILSFP